MAAAKLFDLTPLLGEAKAARTSTTQGFEINSQVQSVGILSGVAGLLVTAMLLPFIGQYAVFVPPVVIVLGLWGFIGRSNRGLRQKNWQRVKDIAKNNNNQFMLCGRPIDPTDQSIRQIVWTTGLVPQRGVVEFDASDLLSSPSRKR